MIPPEVILQSIFINYKNTQNVNYRWGSRVKYCTEMRRQTTNRSERALLQLSTLFKGKFRFPRIVTVDCFLPN